MTDENQKLCGEMVGIANVYKNSSEVLNIGNIITKLLGERQNVTVNGRPIEFDHVILSRVILLAIDIEILLKAISLADNDTPASNVHDWTKLFNTLSASHQQEIISNMPQCFQADFPTLLDNNKNAFIRWRYSYEYDNLTCDWTFINDLANVLGSIAMQVAR
jgi:hypothetical protein